MNWLVSQLFGAQAAAHLGATVRAAVATYLLSQPSATVDQVKAMIVSRADSLINSVVAFVPAWARPFLAPILDSAVAGLVDNAYKSLTKAAQPTTGNA